MTRNLTESYLVHLEPTYRPLQFSIAVLDVVKFLQASEAGPSTEADYKKFHVPVLSLLAVDIHNGYCC